MQRRQKFSLNTNYIIYHAMLETLQFPLDLIDTYFQTEVVMTFPVPKQGFPRFLAMFSVRFHFVQDDQYLLPPSSS